METKGFSKFEIIVNVLVRSFRFIRIPMLWVFGYYECIYSFGAGTDFIRQNLTSTDVRFCRIKTVPALKGLITLHLFYIAPKNSLWCHWHRPFYYINQRPKILSELGGIGPTICHVNVTHGNACIAFCICIIRGSTHYCAIVLYDMGRRGSCYSPSKKIQRPNVGLMLGHRRRRWTNIDPIIASCLLLCREPPPPPQSVHCTPRHWVSIPLALGRRVFFLDLTEKVVLHWSLYQLPTNQLMVSCLWLLQGIYW